MIIYFIGFVLFLTAIVNMAKTPLGQVCSKGIYRYSRHPMQFFSCMTYIGVGIASASWIFLLLSIVLILLQRYRAIPEERVCLEVFGDDYRKYINRIPRWLGKPSR
jgi:protein-S-isoprenylcysteine O-methyltransferase Ste14